MSKLWSTEEIETLRRMRCEQGLTVAQIAKVMGRPEHGVRKQLSKHELYLPLGHERTTPVSCRPEVMAQLREAFYNGTTAKDAGQSVGIWGTTVSHIFMRFSDELLQKSDLEIDVGQYVGGKEMVAIAAHACGVPVRAVLGNGRFRPVVLARIAVARALRDRGVSMTNIAKAIGRGDHTTVRNLLMRFPEYSVAHWELAHAYQAIKDAERKGMERLAA